MGFEHAVHLFENSSPKQSAQYGFSSLNELSLLLKNVAFKDRL